MKVLCDRIKVSHVQEPVLSINSRSIQVSNNVYVCIIVLLKQNCNKK